MSRGGQLAVAAATGYALGRGRRMRWALALAAAAATGRLTAGRGGLTDKLGLLRTSAGLGRLLDAGRPLVSATGAAARTAVGGRVDAAADRLQQTAQRLRGPGRQDADEGRGREPVPEDADADADERYAGEQDDDYRYDDENGYDDRDDDVRDDDEDGEDEDGEDEDGEDGERDDARGRGRARAAERPKAPVRRRGR